MRFTLNKEGDIKEKTFFAFFPVKIGLEVKWLEVVTVRYIYTECNGIGSFDKSEFLNK